MEIHCVEEFVHTKSLLDSGYNVSDNDARYLEERNWMDGRYHHEPMVAAEGVHCFAQMDRKENILGFEENNLQNIIIQIIT